MPSAEELGQFNGFRPVMSESARKRLQEISMGGRSKEVPLLIRRVIKIQALFRGFMVRRRLETIRNLL